MQERTARELDASRRNVAVFACNASYIGCDFSNLKFPKHTVVLFQVGKSM